MKQPWQQPQDQLQRMQKQQQENASRQQEQIRQRQEMGHWYQEQREKQQRGIKTKGPIMDKFAEVKTIAAGLKLDVQNGKLTRDEFKARLSDLMFQDEDKTWWMVGAETLEWYNNRGAGWVRAEPKRFAPVKAPKFGTNQNIAGAARAPRRLLAIFVFLVCIAVTGGVGFGVGALLYSIFKNNPVAAIGAAVFWLAGLILSIIASRKLWRGR
jgi:hypothetical protein